jgi:hypothetical protein
MNMVLVAGYWMLDIRCWMVDGGWWMVDGGSLLSSNIQHLASPSPPQNVVVDA